MFAVGSESPFVGDAGSTAATFTGGIALDTALPMQDGKAVVSAATPIAAIQAALVNSITATVGTTTATYSPDPEAIATTTTAQLPFFISTTTTTGQYVLHLEDLALMPGVPPDWDYNDRAWTVTVTELPPISVTPLSPVIATLNDPDRVIELTDVFFDPQGVATYSATSSAPDVVAVAVDQGALALDFSAVNSGAASVTLTASVPGEAPVSTTFEVRVLPPTTTTVSWADAVAVGSPYTVTIDPHGESVSHWQVVWGDGQSEVIPGGIDPVQVNHTFAAPGEQLVEVKRSIGLAPFVLVAVNQPKVVQPTSPSAWRVSSVRKTEGNAGDKNFVFKVTAVAPWTEIVKVKWRTLDGTATTADGDYTSDSGELTFNPGDTEKEVTVKVKGDATVEPDEEFFLALEVPAFNNDNRPTSTLTPFGRGFIENDDGLATTDPWADWEQVANPHQKPEDYRTPWLDLGNWRKGLSGTGESAAPTMTTPKGPTWTAKDNKQGDPLAGEGPYLRYKGGQTPGELGAFKFTVEWRALDDKPVPPMPGGEHRPAQQQHNSNSGVYIYDRYEVQIVDPSKFTAGIDADKDIVGTKTELKDQLLPGGLYGTEKRPVPAASSYRNRAKPTGEWNKMVIEFDPPLLDGPVIVTPAWLKVTYLIGETPHVVYKSELKLPDDTMLAGTGSQGGLDPLDKGTIFLQSHWGSQVEFRNPKVTEGGVTRE